MDLRPFMIERAYTAGLHDSFGKVMNLMKLMQVRQLPVVDENDGKVKGILTK